MAAAAAAVCVSGCCPYPSDPEQHPTFVYLASDKRFSKEPSQQDLIPFVLLCANPFVDIRRQNREPGFPGGDHTTKPGAGFLQLEMVLGPMMHKTAVQLQQLWRSRSRKMIQRIQTGYELGVSYGVGISCRDKEWTRSILRTQGSNRRIDSD